MNSPIFPFPYLLHGQGIPVDGMVYVLPQFCRVRCNTTVCRQYYQNDIEYGWNTCPYGLSVYKKNMHGFDVVFTSLYIQGVTNKNMLKRLKDKETIAILPKGEFQRIVENTDRLLAANNDFTNDALKSQEQRAKYQEMVEIMENTFHELRPLNAELKSKTEIFIGEANASKDESLEILAKQILSASQLVSIRLNAMDFGVNQEQAFIGQKTEFQIHRKFTKVGHILEYRARSKGITIELSGNTFMAIDAYDVLELLPFVLIDNAIKYGQNNTAIKVSFSDVNGNTYVYVEGRSVHVKPTDVSHLTERGFRGANSAGESKGEGLGLYFAKLVCDVHSIDISFKSTPNIQTIDDKKYSTFTVTLIFHNVYRGKKTQRDPFEFS